MTPWQRHERIGKIGGREIPMRGFPERALIYAITSGGVVLYVGSTETPIWRRIRDHIQRALSRSDAPIHVWMRENDFRFEVEFLEEVPAAERHDAERRQVAIHRSTALNLSDGGPGHSGYRFAGTGHAEKIAQKLRQGSNCTCETCGAQFWRKPRDIKQGNNRFCSRGCYQAWQRARAAERRAAQ